MTGLLDREVLAAIEPGSSLVQIARRLGVTRPLLAIRLEHLRRRGELERVEGFFWRIDRAVIAP